MEIKDSLLIEASLCEYTWEVVACMKITSEGQVGPDMELEIQNQGTGTKNIIIITWFKEALCQR